MPFRIVASACLVAALFFVSLPAHAQHVRLSGAVTDSSTDSLRVSVARVMLASAEPDAFEHYVVPARDFDLSVDTESPVYLLVQGGEHRLPPLLVEPGADLDLTASGDRWTETAEVTGDGAAGGAYALGERPHDRWRRAMREGQERLSAPDPDLAGYLRWVDSVRVAEDAALDAARVSPLYRRVQRAENVAMAVRMKQWAGRGLGAEAAARLQDDLMREVLSAQGGDTLAYALRYTEMLGDFLDTAYREAVAESGGTPSTSGFYHFRKSASAAPALRQVLLAEVLQSLLRTEDYDDEMARLVEDFARSAPDVRYRDYVAGLAARRETLAPGRPAPDFVVETIEGEALSLGDLRGRVVLGTVWGSWCSKSTAELPWLERVRERLAGEDVVFLNLAYDQEEPWREAVAERTVGGVHALTDEATRRAYGIVGTPTLFLIDRDGTVVTSEVPRPSEREGRALEEAIRRAL